MAKKDTEQDGVALVAEDEPSPVADSPVEQAAGFVKLAIEALGQSRSVKHGEAFQYIKEKLEWLAKELEERL